MRKQTKKIVNLLLVSSLCISGITYGDEMTNSGTTTDSGSTTVNSSDTKKAPEDGKRMEGDFKPMDNSGSTNNRPMKDGRKGEFRPMENGPMMRDGKREEFKPMDGSGSMDRPLMRDGKKGEFRPMNNSGSIDGSGSMMNGPMMRDGKRGEFRPMNNSGSIDGSGSMMRGDRRGEFRPMDNSGAMMNNSSGSMMNGSMMKEGRKGDWDLKNYLRTDLTQDEMKAVGDLMMTTGKSIQDVMNDTTIKIEDKSTKIESIRQSTIDTLVANYIDTTKVEDFKKFAEQKTQEMLQNIEKGYKENMGNRENMGNNDMPNMNRGNMKKQKSFISEKTKQSFLDKLNSIPDDKKAEIYNNLLTKITTLIDSTNNSQIDETKKQKTVGILNELYTLVDTQLQDLQGSGDENNLIDDILTQ